MQRERNEKIAFARLIVQACTVDRGVKPEYVDDILEEYREEITQERYNLGYQDSRQRKLLSKMRENLELSRRMAKVESMTVTDKEFEDFVNARK
jgi:hypothetical protein